MPHVQLEHEGGIPRNPFINAGAIVTTDSIIAGHAPEETIGEILRFVRELSGDSSILIDPVVAAEETATGYRNFALANFLRAYGNLHHSPEMTLGVYFHHCAIAMTCLQLASAGRFLANAGRATAEGSRIIGAAHVRRINALLLTCGLYDDSGGFAFHVALHAKSGVGGGILAIAPGLASIAVWSPGLNKSGTSELGVRALERLVQRTWLVHFWIGRLTAAFGTIVA
jgi:glutaminase